MSRPVKITVIIISILLTLIVLGGYIALKIFSEAFGADCEKSNNWTIGAYKIQEYKCLGWAGPHYYPADLYKNGKRIDKGKILKDSCYFRFRPEDDLYLKFNICDSSFTEIRANKLQLHIDKISLVSIRNCQTGKTKALGEKAIKKFAEDWNESKISDYRYQDPVFYPNKEFEIVVSHKNDEIKFIGCNNLIADESNWVYFMANNDTTYFDRLMTEKYR